jgi:hypothetical protein
MLGEDVDEEDLDEGIAIKDEGEVEGKGAPLMELYPMRRICIGK